MKTTQSVCAVAVLLMAAMAPTQALTTTAAEPAVLRDGDGAKKIRFDGLHKVREAKTGKLVAACYNSTLTPNPIPTSKETAPQVWAEGLDFAKMKQEFGVLGASLNGPKLWMCDWVKIQNGVVRGFDRVKTLEQDLIERPEGGVATIMPDEFFNMDDKTGPDMNNPKN